jgi:high-affinity iron transporter
MLGLSVIFFREVLEVMLIISIVVAATNNIKGRIPWIVAGLLAGIFASVLIAYGITLATLLLSGIGQDILNVIVMSITVLTIGWTVLIMSKQSVAQLQNALKTIESDDKTSLYIIALIVMTAVIREGTELVLLSYGLVTASNLEPTQIITGALLGAIFAVLIGLCTYFGLLTLPKKYLFKVTSWMLVLIAAGIAAQIPNYLASAGLLNSLVTPLWNTSWLLSESTLAGNIVHVLTGYTATPSAAQLLFYIITFGCFSIVLTKSRQVAKP